MTIAEQLKLNAIDIAGLNPDDRSWIEAIGLRAWLDEVVTSPAPLGATTHQAGLFLLREIISCKANRRDTLLG